MTMIGIILLFLVSGAYAHVEDGDALQLRSYYADTNQPGVIDADIAGADPTKWKNAYVRSIEFNGPDSGGVRDATLLITNDGQFLYVAVAAKIQDNGANNFCRLYFDQNHNHSMDVSTSTSQGEYYVEAKTGGPFNGGWTGGSWYEYSSTPAGLEAAVDSTGTGATQVWNFEFKIPLSGGISGSDECYLNVNSADELGLFIHIFVSADKHIYWTDTNMEVSNNEPNNPAGWGDNQLGVEAPLRTVYAPIAMGHEPTVDGYIIDDSTWSHYTTNKRDIVLTNYTGAKVNGTVYAKNGGAEVFLGLVISTAATTGDYLTMLLDYDDGAGDDVDYELTDNYENGITINYTGAGTGSFSDKYFDSASPEWLADAGQDGSGAVRHNGTSYEYECSIPLKGTGTFDLQVATGALLGLNIKVLINGSTFWWYAGTNSEWQQIRLDNNVYTSLGWGFLQTGSPVIQPIFPKDDDEVSGHYPFMVYATGAGGVGQINSVNVEYTISGSTTTLVLERADEDGYWTKTWNTTSVSYESNLELRIEATDTSGVETKAVINVTIDNTGGSAGNDPVVEITIPKSGALLNGTTRVSFNAWPNGGTLDDVEITIDGYVIDESSWVNVNSYNSSGGTGYYDWNTTVYPDSSAMKDGEHIIQVRAHDTENLWGYSANRLVYVDNTGPTISNVSIVYPDGQTMAKTGDRVLISAQVTDSIAGVNDSSVVLNSSNLDGNTSHTLVDNGTGGDKVSGDKVYSYEVTITAAGTGAVNFTISASDNLGNAASALTGTASLDNTVPVVNINSVVTPTKLSNQTVTGSYTEVNLDRLLVNGIEATISGSNYSAVVPLIEGSNIITAYIEDKAGNISTSTANIFYDPNSPVSIVRPDSDSKVKGITSIEVIAREITQEVRFEVSLNNGVTWYSLAGALEKKTTDFTYIDGWKQDWDTNLLADATNYRVRVYSYSAEAATPTISATSDRITVDNTAPVVTFSTSSFSPLPKLVKTTYYIYVDQVRMSFSAIDATAGMGSVKITSLNENGDKIFYADVIPAKDGTGDVVQYLPLVQGKNVISVQASDVLGNTAATLTETIYYAEPKGSEIVSSAGGTVESPDGTSVVIPDGALLEDTKVTITVVDESELPKPTDSYVKLVGVARDFGPDGLVFVEPVTITLAYAEADLDTDLDGVADFDESKLELFFWDGWQWLNVGASDRDAAANTISARVNHFTIFAIAQNTRPVPTLTKVFLTRNPFRVQDGTDFMYDLTQPGRVSIKIYDLAGDMVCKLVDKVPDTVGRRSKHWKGDNEFGNYVGSGIYIYFIEIEYNDGTKETIKDTIGVVK